MENMNKCPGCSQHCDKNNLQCGKGESYFNDKTNTDFEHAHAHHENNHHGPHKEARYAHHKSKHCGHHEGKHKGHCEGKHHIHGHHHPEFPAGSLADLMAKCGHRLFHGGDESMFVVLTECEQSTLKDLLAKLLGN